MTLAACFSPYKNDEAAITIYFASGRAAGAPYPLDTETLARLTHTVALRGPTGTETHTLEQGALSARFTLAPGNWTVSVEALLDGTLYAVGSGSAEIRPGETTDLMIEMRDAGTSAPGTDPSAPDNGAGYTITFVAGFGADTMQRVAAGGRAQRPADPSRAGWSFVDWYKEEACLTLWDFARDTVTADTALYAKWDPQVIKIAAGFDYSVALKADGSLWGWGENSYGQLGLGDTAGRRTPERVGTDTDWTFVAARGMHTIALKADGSLWAWGLNDYCQLGLGVGDTTQRNAPERVGTDTDWTFVAAGGMHTIARKADGSLWAWGMNDAGQLGLGVGDTTQRDAPERVGTELNWASVSAGGAYTVALKTDGSLYVWGDNYAGQLGLENMTNSTTPVQVGTDTDWTSVSAHSAHTVAIKNGSLFAWGDNEYGQLGLGNSGTGTERSTPVEVTAAGGGWASVSAGGEYTVAFKTDGSFWAWGRNDRAQLGLGDTTQRDAPARVGTDTNWTSVEPGIIHTLAIKTDGSLWVWGSNEYGALGIDVESDFFVPTRLVFP